MKYLAAFLIFKTGLEVRSLLNLKINPPLPSELEYEISNQDLQNLRSPLFENGFVRDSEDGLVYDPDFKFNDSEPNTEFATIGGSWQTEETVQRPEPVDQPKSEDDDYIDTVHGYLLLKRLLQGVIEVEINDIYSSIDLIRSEFRIHYDRIVAGCNICSMLDNRRLAIYRNDTSKLYQKGQSIRDTTNVSYCEISSEN